MLWVHRWHGELSLLSRHGCVGSSIELGAALETVVWLGWREERVAIDADLLLGDYVLLLLVEPLAGEERVFVDMTCYLLEHCLCQLLDQRKSLLTELEVSQMVAAMPHELRLDSLNLSWVW